MAEKNVKYSSWGDLSSTFVLFLQQQFFAYSCCHSPHRVNTKTLEVVCIGKVYTMVTLNIITRVYNKHHISLDENIRLHFAF